jgi:hypothetical protein
MAGSATPQWSKRLLISLFPCRPLRVRPLPQGLQEAAFTGVGDRVGHDSVGNASKRNTPLSSRLFRRLDVLLDLQQVRSIVVGQPGDRAAIAHDEIDQRWRLSAGVSKTAVDGVG